jgi:serine protease Do
MRDRRSVVIFFATITFLFSTQGFAQQAPDTRSFAEVTKRVAPAVVSIDAKSAPAAPVARATPSSAEESEVLDMLRRQIQQRPVYAVGSGFIVDPAGYILTNAHVIEGCTRILVRLVSGEDLVAQVIGTDEETDLAVLKVTADRPLPYLKLGDSDSVEVGDWVLAIGSPFGLAKTVTAGIISQTQRETPFTSAFQRFIQTDAAINRGNSGGPLVNLSGEAIGVNSQIATSTGDYNGIGFALPSTEAAFVYNQIRQHGRVRRGYLGAFLDSVRTEFAKVYGLGDGRGAIITDVRDRKGPAAVAGLQQGDVIVEFQGKPVMSAQDLIAKVASTPPDQTVAIRFIRENGSQLVTSSINAVLAERPVSDRAAPDERTTIPARQTPEPRPFGLTLLQLTPQNATTHRMEGQKGLVIREIEQSSFITDVRNNNGQAALVPGDVIQRINRTAVADIASFDRIVSGLKPGDPVVLHVAFYNQPLRTVQMKIVQFSVR